MHCHIALNWPVECWHYQLVLSWYLHHPESVKSEQGGQVNLGPIKIPPQMEVAPQRTQSGLDGRTSLL